MLSNLCQLVAGQPPAIGRQPVHGPVVALMLKGQEEALGDKGTQTTTVYGVSRLFVCVCECFF